MAEEVDLKSIQCQFESDQGHKRRYMAKNEILKFGWCGTNEHEKCIKVLPSFPETKCLCDCHGIDKQPETE